jgi:NTP pyrophosphatase (non-canonical NTP hydrolase)
LGDVLWYISNLSHELKIDLEDVANTNLNKLFSRLERNKINGSGDNR